MIGVKSDLKKMGAMLAEDRWDVSNTAEWIVRTVLAGREGPGRPTARPHARICLQLPDDMLGHAAELSAALQSALDLSADIYILADTTYNALSVDEVASQHVDADCLIHYGRASLSKTTGRLPVYYVLPREDNYRYEGDSPLGLGCVASTSGPDVGALASLTSSSTTPTRQVTVFVDQVFKHAMDEVSAYIRGELLAGCTVAIPGLIGSEGAPSVGGYEAVQHIHGGHRGVGGDIERDSGGVFMWYGLCDAPAREMLMLTYNARTWVSVDPIAGTVEHGLPPKLQQTLRKRYFLVDKARQANIVGLVVGTLAANGYKESINALRVAATKADKKTYTLLMGKPSPAKLANFPEIDVFVLVADPQGMILDSKEYYAPIITPYEAMMAFSENAEWEQHKYSLELTADDTPSNDPAENVGSQVNALVLQAQEALQVADIGHGTKDIIVSSGAEYLIHKRTWKGVDSGRGPGEKKEASAVALGRSGRAAGYGGERA
jgi:diphthamide biosynthesis protein 2